VIWASAVGGVTTTSVRARRAARRHGGRPQARSRVTRSSHRQPLRPDHRERGPRSPAPAINSNARPASKVWTTDVGANARGEPRTSARMIDSFASGPIAITHLSEPRTGEFMRSRAPDETSAADRASRCRAPPLAVWILTSRPSRRLVLAAVIWASAVGGVTNTNVRARRAARRHGGRPQTRSRSTRSGRHQPPRPDGHEAPPRSPFRPTNHIQRNPLAGEDPEHGRRRG
jgi:hypothetical protein